MASLADKNLSKEAQDEINRITVSAQKGETPWEEANKAANEVRAREGADYTVSRDGTTTYDDGSTISSFKTGSKRSSSGKASSGGSPKVTGPVSTVDAWDTMTYHRQPGLAVHGTAQELTRAPALAGQSVKIGDYTVTFDERGYARKKVKDGGASATGSVRTSKNYDSADHLQAYLAAMAGDWDQAASFYNNVGSQEPVDEYGNRDLSESKQYAYELKNEFGYNANQYYNSRYDQAYGAGSAAVWDATNGAIKTYGELVEALGPEKAQQVVTEQIGKNPSIYGLTGPSVSPTPGGGAGSVPGAGLGGVVGSNKVTVSSPTYDPYEPGSMGDYLDQWLAAAQKQQVNTIDYGTNQAVLELVRAEQDAQSQFQQQRNQIAIDEANALDNQALYAEARGDKGGIGQAQYNSIMNTAAQNRLQVSQAQTQLSTDTARQIADLRAQGEYEKADALLTLTQKYLSELISLEQWSMEYGLSVAQFNASLQQWQAEYEMAVADLTGYYNGAPTLANQKAQDAQLADAGQTLLAAGIMPSASQLAAMGLTTDQAQSLMTAAQLKAAKGNGGGGGGLGSPTDVYEWLWRAGAKDAGTAYQILRDNGYGTTDANKYSDYYNETWYPENATRYENVAEADAYTANRSLDREAEAISAWLQQGMQDNANARVQLLLENNLLTDGELADLKSLYNRLGYQLNIS